MRLAFSPDGQRLAVGYYDVAAIDILDGTTLKRVRGQSVRDVVLTPGGLRSVGWSRDGRTLFAAGAVHDPQRR